MTRRVVVTGVGMVTPLGADAEETWSNVCAGRSGVGPVTRFDASDLPVTFAAEVVHVAPHPADGGDLKLRLAATALEEALAQSGPVSGPGTGVCLGSEIGRPALDVLANAMRDNRAPSRADLERMDPAAPTRLVASMAGATGPQSTVSTACTSSSQAVGEGVLKIRRGDADAMIVGGVDVLVDAIMITGFAKLGALSERNDDPQRASRPFDSDRDGFVLGEGAGILILEDRDRALARGATILAEISGYGCSCNAYRITDSPPDGRGAHQSMQAALDDAGLEPEAIGYINAHGTSTPMNDPSEARGIHRTFASPVPVSSTKSSMGHLVAACGAVEAILCVLAIRDQRLPPTINLVRPDASCDLDHVANAARDASVTHAMTNAFGFGGSNGSLVVSKHA
ncbi:MAG: beta-ketoacyl-[acyl-carrier-protein] synthase family protein [Myxococcota bacterium]|nr:beta-ketoacyl-[acyl-carrier-protein] synthase family protein [Myxococcota bacterium]